MDGEKQKKTGQTVHIIYALAVAVSLVFLAFGLLFIRYTTNVGREETIGYIQDALQQTKYAVEKHIRDELNGLMAAAVAARNKDLLTDGEALGNLANALHTHSNFTQVGFADPSGKAVWRDKDDRAYFANLSGEGFFERSLAGENAVSRMRRGGGDGLEVHYYSVPIYDGESSAIKGVLFAATPQDHLREVVNNSLFAAKGLAHIIDSNGDYVVASDSPLVIGIGDNIFELAAPLSPEAEREIRENLVARKASYLVKTAYGDNRLAAYAPLDINDWLIFYAVPESMVSTGLRAVTFGAITTVCVATGTFVLLIVLIHQTDSRNRKALEDLAFVDATTGHPNFQKFLLDAGRELKRAKGDNYAVCYCDIKDFRYVNDVFGRDVGGRMLRYLADFLDRISLEGEVFGRIGEDNFVALRRYKSKREIEQRFEGAARQLAIFPETFSQGYKAELYGGVYLLDPADGPLTLNDMMDRAISAMEEAKFARGEKRLGIYSKQMREQKLWETEMESRMDWALENGEFKVYLQPKIDIQHGNRILGAEALVRWDVPGKGLIPPGRFIDLFEKNGFIVELDRFVFQEACRYYRENVLNGGLFPYILSVNVSRLGLMRPDFIRAYTQIKEAHGIPDGCIELEFTESLVFGNHLLFKTIVTECKHSGFLCSMDDFGAGYSSLNMLKSIHVDVLKLDRQFFLYGDDAERGQELVKNIIAMARVLGMKTVAEGIDKDAQVEQLRAMGCDAIQGYVFAKPMPAEQFGPFIASWQGKSAG